MGSLEMGSWGHFRNFMPSKSSMGLSGPTGAWQGGCLRPWELPHVMLCADATDNPSFEVWDISPEQTPGKEKLVKSQLLPGRDSWVTKAIALCCLRSPLPPRKLCAHPHGGFLCVVVCMAPPHTSPFHGAARGNSLG